MASSDVRFKLTLHYDGSGFHGWQAQPSQATVQGAMEDALVRLTGERRPVVGAGRTDSGVHATGQVASVVVPERWTPQSLGRALNALLPDTVWVRRVEAVARDFHPRYDAIERSYAYRLGTAPRAASPFHRRWCWPLCRPIEIDAAARAARTLIGEQDCRAFAKTGQPQRGTACRITEARWRPWNDLGFRFEISANRFLHRMVRYLVGTMVEIASGRRDEGDMIRLLRGTRKQGDSMLTTSPPAPPGGLFLTRVRYPGLLAALIAGTAITTASCEPAASAMQPAASAVQPAAAAVQPVVASAQQSVSQSRTTAIVTAARIVAPAVVTISVRRRERYRVRTFFDDYYLPFPETHGLGSGFIIDARGTVLTNHHVVDGASEILVTLPDARDFEARLVGSDPATDIAVLALEDASDLPVAPLGTATDLMIGEWTVAIGNPFGGHISNLEPSVTAGVVSALGRHIVPETDDEGFYLGMIQTDASINPGNSGGPLVNSLGQVIGINASILSRSGGSEGLGFAIPIDRALKIAADLARYGTVRRAWLGLDVDAVEADNFGRLRDVRVARVTPGSPAERAGIRAGARLLQAGRNRMATPLDYEAALLDLRAGDEIELLVEGMDPVLVEAAALPSLTAERVELLRDLEVVTVTPGIQAERELASSDGALVVEISELLARRTGLARGDVLLAVNNTRLRSARDAANELRKTQQSGRAFVLLFERNGRLVRTGLLEWS